MITVRLDKKLEDEIKITSKSIGISKSELIRRSIQEYLQKNYNRNSWDLGKSLFGKYSSTKKNLAQNSEKIFKSKIRKTLK